MPWRKRWTHRKWSIRPAENVVQVLVSDTSVFIDLERAELIEVCFTLPYQFAVPDVMYERELEDYGGPELIRHGLEVVKSSDQITTLATQYARTVKSISVPDAFAIALAKSHGWQLLAGDGGLRNLAAAEQVDCHGVLWVFDQLHTTKSVRPRPLYEALTIVSEHPRCRLPRREIQKRLKIYQPANR